LRRPNWSLNSWKKLASWHYQAFHESLGIAVTHGEKGGWLMAALQRLLRLNAMTTPDRYTCPNIGNLTARLAGCRVFSKLDLRKGYHKVPVRPEDVEKTAMITPFGLLEYVRMPFGLRNAGQTFQRLMDQVLRGLDFCFVYLDDILIASSSEAEHVQHLAEVFQRLRSAKKDCCSTGRSVFLT
jgi:hypothetical protein